MDKSLLYLLMIFGAGWLITDEFFGKGLISRFVQSSFAAIPKKDPFKNDKGTVTGIPKKLTPEDPTFSGIGPGAMG